MKKKLFLLLMMLFCIKFAIAEPVGVDRARQVAMNFLKLIDNRIILNFLEVINVN